MTWLTQPVGDIARELPGATGVFHELTRGINLPAGACNTWRALYLGLATFEVDLMDHIHLENNILFERIDGRGAVANGSV